MVHLNANNPYLDLFWKMLVYFCPFGSFGIACAYLVYFSRFGMFYKEKSGNPAPDSVKLHNFK
jgi:hypothetical protein